MLVKQIAGLDNLTGSKLAGESKQVKQPAKFAITVDYYHPICFNSVHDVSVSDEVLKIMLHSSTIITKFFTFC